MVMIVVMIMAAACAVVAMVMVVVVIMAAACAVVAMVMVMVMVVIMMMVLVVVVVIMAAACAVVAMVMVMVVIMVLVVMIVMVSMSVFLHQFLLKIVSVTDCTFNCCAFQPVPRRSNDGSLGVLFSDKLDTLFKLSLIHVLSPAYYYGCCTFNLIVVELAKILHVHFGFLAVNNCNSAVYFNTCLFAHIGNRSCNIA